MHTVGWTAQLQEFLVALGAAPTDVPIQITGAGRLVSRYPVTELACASIGAASVMLARWMDPSTPLPVTLDRTLASRWFGTSLLPQGWSLPSVRAPLTGDYPTRDGWIRIHVNAHHHLSRTLKALGLDAQTDRETLAKRVMTEDARTLESWLVEAGACAAALRTPEDWAMHPQGRALAAEPLAHVRYTKALPLGAGSRLDPARPLAGVRVLDLTRVLAGPVATRFLAAYGAEVLRIDPMDWDEPGMVPEVTVGKRCATLDLHRAQDRDRFEVLLSRADVLVHGYRPGALDALGLDEKRRQAIRPGLVDVSLDAWGWTGPWKARRGFDSLVQMSTGIAWPGEKMHAPDPLPVQALDQATGYWMAACVLRGLAMSRYASQGSLWRVSLARMAGLLTQSARTSGWQTEAPIGAASILDYVPEPEYTAWGAALRLRAPCRIGALEWRWERPAGPLRAHPPVWKDQSSEATI